MGEARKLVILLSVSSFVAVVQALQHTTASQKLSFEKQRRANGQDGDPPSDALSGGGNSDWHPFRAKDLEPPGFQLGLRETAYFLDCNEMQNGARPNLDEKVPHASRVAANVNFQSVRELYHSLNESRSECRAVRFVGKLLIGNPGNYTFIVKTFGQAQLRINKKVLVDMTDTTKISEAGTINVSEPGGIWLALDYWNRGPEASIVLKYIGPDTLHEKLVVPRNAFAIRINPETSTTVKP